MPKSLTPEEFESLVASAQRSAPQRPSGKRVEHCDLRRASQLSDEHVRVITLLHESLARRLGNSLGAYLRVGFEMNLVSVEQLTYGEYLRRMVDLTYFASLRILPIDARAALQADLSLVYPIVDLVLGGSGVDPIELRDLTEIEEQIFESVVRLIARDLQTTWTPVIELDIQFEQRQLHTQVQGLMLPTEKILSLNFEIRLPEARGNLSLAFPAVVSNALLRKLSVQWSYSERIPSREMRRRLRERLLGSYFRADLSLPLRPLSIRELVSVEPGRVIVLPLPSQEPIHLNIAGRPMFMAYPVRNGTQRGARVERRLSILSTAAKESK